MKVLGLNVEPVSCGAELMVQEYAFSGCRGDLISSLSLPQATCAPYQINGANVYYTATCSGTAATSLGVVALLAAAAAAMRAL